MEDYRQQQIEALQVAHEYGIKLVQGIKNVAEELEGNRLPDTDVYLDEVIKGINWTIEILNRTMDVLNEKEVQIDKDTANIAINKLGEALASKQDITIAAALKDGVLPFVEKLVSVTEAY